VSGQEVLREGARSRAGRAVTADRVCLRASMTDRPMSSARAPPVHCPPETTTDWTWTYVRGVIWCVCARPAQGDWLQTSRNGARTHTAARLAGIPAGHTCVHVRVRRRHCLRTHADRQVDPFGQAPGSHAMCWTVLVLPHTDCRKNSFSK